MTPTFGKGTIAIPGGSLELAEGSGEAQVR